MVNIRHKLLLAAILHLTWLSAQAESTDKVMSSINTVVVIYGENRSFDNLYGLFPGARGINEALKKPDSYLQRDRDGSILSHLPPVWTASTKQKDSWAFVGSLPNRPFKINQPHASSDSSHPVTEATPDLVHRFYNNQMQINQGRNDQYVAWSDAGGLSMGYYDGSSLKLWKLARNFTLADNFFQGAFGGSFLNHFWLVCACTPPWANPPNNLISVVQEDGIHLKVAYDSPSSALDGKPKYVNDGSVSALWSDGRHYAINTVQPPYQPSGTPPKTDGDSSLADVTGGGVAGKIPLPPISRADATTIGDTLTDRGISWAWYAGGWNNALNDRSVIYNNGDINFQPHHQPFNYFDRFDPSTETGRHERAEHLKDEGDLITAIQNGNLPQVVFYKPEGYLNQHPGYASVVSGDNHIAEIIDQLRHSPQWPNMVIFITYDENGGFFDHVSPPKMDAWGPGTRVPLVIISPYARRGYVDHNLYDTTSILKFITKRFELDPLVGVRDQVGDLRNTLRR